MAKRSVGSQTHSASRVISASARAIYDAHLDPDSVAAWRPPDGMTARIDAFDAREGGVYRMAFLYDAANKDVPGKTSEHEDAFEGRFVQLVPNEKIVEEIAFKSHDLAFQGLMTITTTLTSVPGGTDVSIVCSNVPSGISESDHQQGMVSTLKNLAAFTEQGDR